MWGQLAGGPLRSAVEEDLARRALLREVASGPGSGCRSPRSEGLGFRVSGLGFGAWGLGGYVVLALTGWLGMAGLLWMGSGVDKGQRWWWRCPKRFSGKGVWGAKGVGV